MNTRRMLTYADVSSSDEYANRRDSAETEAAGAEVNTKPKSEKLMCVCARARVRTRMV
jgi:hypothetical protein